MNVMGPGTKLLFCEGDPGSYDYGLLSRLLVGRSPSSAIAPGEGSRESGPSFAGAFRLIRIRNSRITLSFGTGTSTPSRRQARY